MRDPVLYYAPRTRAFGALVLLEELGIPHALEVLDMEHGQHRTAAFLALNPLGKVPTLVHDGAVITEQAAVYLYLADRFPAAGLAPALDDPLRGAYLRWMVFYGSSFEPAIVDRALNREPGNRAMSPYGAFDDVVEIVERQLSAGPWMLGERFTAVDVLWACALRWTTGFGIVPKHDAVMAYIARFEARPAMARAGARDAALLAARDAARAAAAKG